MHMPLLRPVVCVLYYVVVVTKPLMWMDDILYEEVLMRVLHSRSIRASIQCPCCLSWKQCRAITIYNILVRRSLINDPVYHIHRNDSSGRVIIITIIIIAVPSPQLKF